MTKFYAIAITETAKAPMDAFTFPEREKQGLFDYLADMDADKLGWFRVVEFDASEGTSRDVSEDIAREMSEAVEFQHRIDDVRDLDIAPFIMKFCETELQDQLDQLIDDHEAA